MDIKLNQSNAEILNLFFKLESRQDVANILEIDINTLIYILYRTNSAYKYKEFNIKKRDGTYRIISSPIGSLKIIQSKLNNILQLVYSEKGKDSAHGFINGRSILTNAGPHVDKNQILNVDLKNFFPSINFGRVRGMFNKTLKIGIEAATTLAQISCNNNALPQGSPCSPIISNLICRRLDTQLYYLAQKNGCKYTRYADDITFSRNHTSIPRNLVFKDNDGLIHIGSDLSKIFKDNGFEINKKKLSLSNQFEHQEVTGLVVNKKINVRYSYIKNLRSMLNKAKKNGIYESAIEYMDKFSNKVPTSIYNAKDNPKKHEMIEKWFLNVICGKLLYLKMIRGDKDLVFLKYATMFNKISDDDFFDVEVYNDLESWFSKRVVVIDPVSDEVGNGTGFFLKDYGLITCHHVIEKMQDFCNIINPYTHYKRTKVIGDIVSDGNLDVAVCEDKDMNPYFEIEENPDYSIGQVVKLAGYPEYLEGNKIDIRECRIASLSESFGQTLYVIDGDIFHGASGGPVLNVHNKVIGIIRCGVAIYDDEDAKDNIKRGFIPIKQVERLYD